MKIAFVCVCRIESDPQKDKFPIFVICLLRTTDPTYGTIYT